MSEPEGPSTHSAAVVGITPQQASALVSGIDGLVGQVTQLSDEVVQDREERVIENQKRDDRIRWSRRAVVAALAVAAIAVVVAFVAVGVAIFSAGRVDAANKAASTAQTQLAIQLVQRDAARKSACEQNVEDDAHINTNTDQDIATLQQALDASTNPDARQFFQSRIDAYQSSRLVRTGPGTIDGHRDCSDAGIKAWYAHTGG